MVRVRLSRGGAKKRPYYHIVVIDQKDRRDGRCLERLGSYDPNLETSDRIKLDVERLEHWVSKGAQLSDRVKFLKKYSLDPNNLENRQKAKSAQLEKLSKKKAAKKAAEEAPAEEVKAEEAPTEEAPAEEVKAEEAPAEEVKAEEAPAEETKDK